MSSGVRQFDDSAHTPTALHAYTSHSPGEVNTTPGRCPQWSAGLTNARACARPQTQPRIRTYHTTKAMSTQVPTGVGGCHKRDFDGCRQVSAIMLHLRCSSWWDGARRRGWRCRGSLSCRSHYDPEVLVQGSTDKTAAALQSSQALHIGITGAWRGGLPLHPPKRPQHLPPWQSPNPSGRLLGRPASSAASLPMPVGQCRRNAPSAQHSNRPKQEGGGGGSLSRTRVQMRIAALHIETRSVVVQVTCVPHVPEHHLLVRATEWLRMIRTFYAQCVMPTVLPPFTQAP